MVDAELALSGYVMFKYDRQERRGGGVNMYINNSIQADEIQMKKEADREEAIWCNITTNKLNITDRRMMKHCTML